MSVGALLTYTQAGAELGVCRQTIAVYVKKGRLRMINPNGQKMIPRAAIDEFLAGDDREVAA